MVSEAFAGIFAQYEEHLRSQRNLSEHTIRAYIGDLTSLAEHAQRMKISEPSALTLAIIRSWLANQQSKGGARTTISRRAVSVRTFTAWAARKGILPTDVGDRLATPRGHRTLPHVLTISEATEVFDSLELAAGEEQTPLALRNIALVELLYATGIRVSEACGMDLADIDRNRNTVRVFGKGRKERTCPIGAPALLAIDKWIKEARPELTASNSGSALFLGARGKRIDPRTVREVVYKALEALPDLQRWVHMDCAIVQLLIYLSVVQICAQYKNFWVMPHWQLLKFIHMFQRVDCEVHTNKRIRGPNLN